MKYDEGLIICIFNNGTWGEGKGEGGGVGKYIYYLYYYYYYLIWFG